MDIEIHLSRKYTMRHTSQMKACGPSKNPSQKESGLSSIFKCGTAPRIKSIGAEWFCVQFTQQIMQHFLGGAFRNLHQQFVPTFLEGKKTYFDGINSNKHVKSFTMIGIMWGLECNQGWYKAGTKLTYQVKH